MRPFWHNMATWAEKPHGFPMSFLNSIITTATTIIILIMIISYSKLSAETLVLETK